jgi:hypothetical protein
MNVKRTIPVILMLAAWASVNTREAAAQDAPQPPAPNPVISLEREGQPAQEAPVAPRAPDDAPPQAQSPPQTQSPRVAPSQQAHDSRSQGRKPKVSRLQNPFEWVPGQRPYGTAQTANSVSRLHNPFEAGGSPPVSGQSVHVSPQYQPTPQVPGKGAMPGGQVPAVEGLPGSGTEPGAAPGTMPGGAPGPGAPGTGGVPGATTEADADAGADTFAEAVGAGPPGFGGGLAAGSEAMAMIGDISPATFGIRNAQSPVGPPGPPRPPGARGGSPIFQSIRNAKISENMSPRPQDRIFFNFNYYNGLNNTINLRDGSPVTRMKAYIYNFGLEKTFCDGMGSVGIRVPLNNLTADSFNNVLSTPTSTSPGNLTVFGKYILAQNPQTGSLVSALFAISPQTGPGRFAGAPYLFPLNSTYFQPAIGYIYNYNRWYFQGFTGFSFSANPNDVSIIYNDFGIGYFIVKNPDRRAFLSALAPTFELHVNNPINHRDVFNRFDIAGSPDTVNLTYGINFGFFNTAVLTAAFVTPVASPKPFDTEALLMLNIYFGRTRANIVQQIPPPL